MEIKEERYYFGDYEVYRKFENNMLKTERTTVNVSDDKKKIVTIDKLTVDQGSLTIPALSLSNGNPTAVVRYQYDNHLGSASLELDESAEIISYEEYHPFGTTSYRSGRTETETSQKRYKYVGKERDEETGLYYYGARYYAAWICRFVSVDPLQFDYPYYTPYQYAGNKPINSIDLDGLEAKNVVDENNETGQQQKKEKVDNPNNDLVITLAWPDKEVSLTPGTKWVEKTGFMDAENGKIKAGHAGAILVNKDNGNVYYYDFGRYETSKGKGRVRDSGTDKNLRLNASTDLIATFDDDGNIENINEILTSIAGKKTFATYKKMIASVTKGVNFEKAREFAESLQAEGEVAYGPFQYGGSNCARFVQDLIIASDPPLAVKIDVSTNVTPSPRGNVENADTEEEIYTVKKGIVTSEKTGITNTIKSWFK